MCTRGSVASVGGNKDAERMDTDRAAVLVGLVSAEASAVDTVDPPCQIHDLHQGEGEVPEVRMMFWRGTRGWQFVWLADTNHVIFDGVGVESFDNLKNKNNNNNKNKTKTKQKQKSGYVCARWC